MEITLNLAIRGNESELSDKTGSVLDSHSSGHYVTAGLKQPTRIRRGSHHRIPIWSCSGRGLPRHKLLPAVRCALTAPFHPYHLTWRSSLCCTCRQLTLPRRYLASYPMEPGLSSQHLQSFMLRDCLANSTLEFSIWWGGLSVFVAWVLLPCLLYGTEYKNLKLREVLIK